MAVLPALQPGISEGEMVNLNALRATRRAVFNEYGMRLHVAAYQQACADAWHAKDATIRRNDDGTEIRVITINNVMVPVIFDPHSASVISALPRATIIAGKHHGRNHN